MNIIGNIIWVVFGGLETALGYLVGGLLLCCTIIGIPFGLQLFKLGLFAFLPFGQTAVVSRNSNGCLSLVMNVLWILIGGFWIALTHLAFGVLLCCTVVGIPFGVQHFKLMVVALLPFGREIVPD